MEIVKVGTDYNINRTGHLNFILKYPLENVRKKRPRDSGELPDFKKLKISDEPEIVITSSEIEDQYIKKKETEYLQNNQNNQNNQDKIINKIYQIEKKLSLFKACTNKYIDHLQSEMNNLRDLMD